MTAAHTRDGVLGEAFSFVSGSHVMVAGETLRFASPQQAFGAAARSAIATCYPRGIIQLDRG